jgi:hypothetical protein
MGAEASLGPVKLRRVEVGVDVGEVPELGEDVHVYW